MGRPCECDRCDVSGPLRAGDCPRCYLWHTDDAYRAYHEDRDSIPGRQAPECIHLGLELTGAEREASNLSHLRAWHHCEAGRGVVCPCGVCRTCPEYRAGEAWMQPPGWPRRLDQATICPAGPGLRLNGSLIAWKDGYAFAYRHAYLNADIYVTTLDAELRPNGPAVQLELTRPEAPWGREDPRLFVHAGQLHLSYTGIMARQGPCNVCYARLGDGFRVEETFAPRFAGRRKVEKNWQFFSHAGSLLAVYSVRPRHVVLAIDGDRAEVHGQTSPVVPWRGGDIRGGAPPVRVGGEHWSFFHDQMPDPPSRTYRMGLYAFAAEPPFRVTRILPDPLVVADRRTKPPDVWSAVVYPVGAVRDGDRWLVSCGIHDRWTEVYTFDHAELESRLASS